MSKPKLQTHEISDRQQSSQADTGLERQLTTDDIAGRAYALYLARGSENGHDVEDWLQAESELLED